MAGGRPKKTINYDLVFELASIMATQEEIASVLSGVNEDISVRTLQRDEKFCHIYKKGIDNAKTSLRRKQFKLAENNATMAIWLGKQYLNQTDKSSLDIEIEDTEALRVGLLGKDYANKI